MDGFRFDALTRRGLAFLTTRRFFSTLPLGTLASVLGIRISNAGPGCKNVGKKCKKARDCCSGVCKGKKGRKKCKAHDTGGCKAGQHAGFCGMDNITCTTSTGQDGVCQTTGNGGYCQGSGLACMTCRADADCRAILGPDAACIRCAPGCETACVGPQDVE